MAKKKSSTNRASSSKKKSSPQLVSIRGISVQTPLAYPDQLTSVKRVPIRMKLYCAPGVICARGTAVHGEDGIIEVLGRVFEKCESTPQDPPSTGNAVGQWSGQNWYFDAAHQNEIYHSELANEGRDMQFMVWIKFSDGSREAFVVPIRVGTVGNSTECG